MDLAKSDLSVSKTGEAYAEFAPYVRRRLLQLGVRDADLSDQCHEVFVILHLRSAQMDELYRVDLWLREVCRRVAARYRRRSGHRLEVLLAPTDLLGGTDRGEAFDPDSPVETLEVSDAVQDALERLDDESRDLLALHDVGGMPLSELAKLVEHDRKTVRKRLAAARQRLLLLLRDDERPSHGQRRARDCPASRASVASAAEPVSENLPLALEVVEVTPAVIIGLIGNIVIAAWPGAVDYAAIETLATVGPRLIERCGGSIGYLSIVGPNVRPPPLAARQRIVQALDEMGPNVLGYATVMLGRGAWIVRPIMSGLLVLARPRFPMRFFATVLDAASWLCASCARSFEGPMAVATLSAAGERLYALSSKGARAH